MSTEYDLAVRELVLKRIHLYQQRVLLPEVVRDMGNEPAMRMMEMYGETMALALTSYIYGLPDVLECISWPSTWWQHFKQDCGGWLGRWLRRKWPVQYETKEVQVYKKVCPHIRAPRDQEACIHWLASEADA